MVDGQSPDLISIAAELDKEIVPFFLDEMIRLEFEIRNETLEKLQQRYYRDFTEYHQTIDLVIYSLRMESQPVDPSTLVVDRQHGSPTESLIGKKLGNYLISKRIGGGAFGVVYLAQDPFLPREVVIKIPAFNRMSDLDDAESFLNEARNASLLDHPNIVKILFVGIDQGLPYIVQDYFENGDLNEAIRQQQPTVNQTIEIVTKIAEAIHFAHEKKIIHRDLKPANILLNGMNQPVVADFGLSLREPALRGRQGEAIGTLRFMSPEQIRGESHRLIPGTDIWSIGVIMYLMLTGDYPFDGETIEELNSQISFSKPKPLRSYNKEICVELQRICFKCLTARVSHRYESAQELAADLKKLLENRRRPSSSNHNNQPTLDSRLIPKGLAAYKASDHLAFLELLPDPKDAHGVPEQLNIWKQRFEDPQQNSPVNVWLGPSGCGKSSLLAAGLAPLLDTKIIVVVVESTLKDTEVRLLQQLRQELPLLPKQSLPQLFAEIRSGRYLPNGYRVLVVFDQFEQWLHGNVIDEHTQLVHALRQCDGNRIWSLILSRSDFANPIMRFFSELEIELVESKNLGSVDLFDRKHAREVLIKLGQAYNRLPKDVNRLSSSNQKFLDKAIDFLAEDNRVTSVKAAIFAQTFKSTPWQIDQLRHYKNLQDIGIEFLEQSLGERTAHPILKVHRERMVAILEALLPPKGVEIKGNFQSREVLADKAGLVNNEPLLGQILNILDQELRLITPTMPDFGQAVHSDDQTYFQLTHDYLVPTIQTWINNTRDLTPRGRAVNKLNVLSERWHLFKDQRYLPGFFDYLSILWNVPRWQRSIPNQDLLWQSTKYYGARFITAIFVLLATGVMFLHQHRQTMVTQILQAKTGALSTIVKEVNFGNTIYAQLIRQRIKNGLSEEKHRRAITAIAMLGEANSDEIRQLVEAIPKFIDAESSNVFAGLAKNSETAIRLIEEKIPTVTGWHRHKLLIFALFLQPDQKFEILEFAADPTERSEFIFQFKTWGADLSQCPKFFDQDRSAGEIHGLCHMLGQIPKPVFDEEVFQQIRDKFQSLYRESNYSAVHSATAWALKQWGEPLPAPEIKPMSESCQWWVNDLGMTFVEVNRPAEKESFYITAHEVTRSAFDCFLADSQADRPEGLNWELNLNPDHPVTEIAIEDAVQFCNWLSEKNGLSCAYERTSNNLDSQIDELTIMADKRDNIVQVLPSIAQWRLVEDATGYRLPNPEQWRCAARANLVVTPNYYSSSEEFRGYDDYLWCSSNSGNQVNAVGQKVPNQIGLFDVLGNVTEFACHHPSADLNGREFIYLFGGSCNFSVVLCQIPASSENLSGRGSQRRRSFGKTPSRNGLRLRGSGFRVCLPAVFPTHVDH